MATFALQTETNQKVYNYGKEMALYRMRVHS